MKFSVVIPCYNSSKTIADTIYSVIKQTNYNSIDEIIVVNDGSNDDSSEIVRKLQLKCSKIRLIEKENGGAASARNIGIQNAKNDWIALLDSDDIWSVDKIEKQENILLRRSEIKALGSNRTGEIIKKGKKIEEGLYRLSTYNYCMKNWPCTPSLVFNKTILSGPQYFPENMSHAEEGIFFLSLAYNSGLYYITDDCVLCGGGKRAFGVNGLSGNIYKMHLGVNEMIRLAAKKGYILKISVPFFILWEFIKYQRRKMIVHKNK